ncbi:MAG: DUF2318 domain-containing protein [Phycisphaeraceae bacterium]
MSRKRKHRALDMGDRQRKREQFTQPSAAPRRWSPGHLGIGLFILAIAAYVIFVGARSIESDPGSAAPRNQTARLASATADGEIRIPIADLADGQARFYKFADAGGVPVRFFALRGSDGVYRAALDACEVCYAGRQGYQQQGDEMVCNKCGRSFPSALINEVTGGCHPIGVPRVVVDGDLVINSGELRTIDDRSAARAAL